MRESFEETRKKAGGILVIDGSMATALEQLGCTLGGSLWTARVLAEQPELVKRVHLQYLRAGADCGITCSYQASVPGLTDCGYTERQAENLIVRSAELFQEAREEWWNAEGKPAGRVFPLCLASAGPYGAYLADGSEYRGDYGVSDEVLRDFHRRRIELLWGAGADLLLFETQPSLREALIEADLAETLGADYWVSFSCRSGRSTCGGDFIRVCAETLGRGHPHLKVIGVNCTPPRLISSLIRELNSGCNLPVAVYPNSGETYDSASQTWRSVPDSLSFCEYAQSWMRAGAVAVGGCCRTAEAQVKEVVRARKIFLAERPGDV